MSEDAKETAASATELVQGIISVEGLENPAVQAEVTKLLWAQKGFHRLTVEGDQLHVSYDPTQITDKVISGLLAKSGHRQTAAELHRASPLAES